MTGDDRTLAALNLQQTLIITTPLILTGLAVAFAFRAGLFNIGGQGQYIVGSIAAVWVGSELAGMPGVKLGVLDNPCRHSACDTPGRLHRWAFARVLRVGVDGSLKQRHHFIRIDFSRRLLAKYFLNRALNYWRAGLAANEDHFVNVSRLQFRVFERCQTWLDRLLDEVSD